MANRRSETTVTVGRPMCYRCFRPHSHCLCHLIAPFEAHCNILILQHPHERKKYYSTARLVTLALRNATLLRGIEFDRSVLEQTFATQNTYLLFPSSKAEDCETTPLDTRSTVIILDGTWEEAGKILYRNPILKELPHLTFHKPLRSTYRIRKQPRDHYLSTIESIGHLLTLNAPSSGHEQKVELYNTLFDGFSKMVEQQLAYFPRMRKVA